MARIFPKIEYSDPKLAGIAEKLEKGERLYTEDGLSLLATADLLSLGKLADWKKETLSGDSVFFSINKHVNYTNVCTLRCDFCRFSRSRNEAGAYELSIKEIVDQIDPEVREVHLVGGLHPDWPLGHYLEMLEAIRKNRPEVSIKAFTAIEISHFASLSGLSLEEVLLELKKAGLTAIPGGGAEVFSPRVRGILCPDKPSGKIWLDVHRKAHGLGIRSNATMLYGHVETPEERISHLAALRELQDQTGGFLCFVPLPFQGDAKNGSLTTSPSGRKRPTSTSVWNGIRNPDPCDDLRMIAVSRLYLDNFPHIKAYWVMLGLETTLMSLSYGADDIDGTVQGEKIAHAAGAKTPLAIDRETIVEMAKQAGKKAVERDSLYNRIK